MKVFIADVATFLYQRQSTEANELSLQKKEKEGREK